jgi:aerobic C4-dicarboxylate transport protein
MQHEAASPAPSTPLYKSLFVQVVVALLIGIALGMGTPGFAQSLKFFSDAFLKLISMIVAPIVFCVVVHGIAGAGDLKKVGRVGAKALLYFEVMTTIALIVGLALAYLVGPGHGMNINTATLDANALSGYTANARKLQGEGIGAFILNIIPTTSFDALARNDVLQVLFFAIIFGTSLALVGEPARKVTEMVDAVSTVLFRAMGLIVRTAPLGVLGAVAYTVGRYGVGSLQQLVSLVVLFYVAIAFFVLVVLGVVMRLAGLSILKFLGYLREELTIVLATASSDAVLPQIMRKLERMGVKPSVVGLVVPTGYSFNLDAFSIYLTLATVFIAQATNTPLSFGDLLLILGISLVTSKGRPRRSGFGHRHPGRHAERGAEHPRDRAGAGAVDRLVHRHGARAGQSGGQLRGDRGDRRLGKGPRPRNGEARPRWRRCGRRRRRAPGGVASRAGVSASRPRRRADRPWCREPSPRRPEGP